MRYALLQTNAREILLSSLMLDLINDAVIAEVGSQSLSRERVIQCLGGFVHLEFDRTLIHTTAFEYSDVESIAKSESLPQNHRNTARQ